jgi:hypothetical protein
VIIDETSTLLAGHGRFEAAKLRGLTRSAPISKRARLKSAIEYVIQDPDLLSRCGDLLIASYNFDGAINQATLVLEDRIRKKAQPPSSSGETLSLRSLGGEPAPIGGAIPGFWRTLWQVWRETKIYD